MKISFLLVCLVFFIGVHSQYFISNSKKKVEIDYEKFLKKNNRKFFKSDSINFLKYSVIDSISLPFSVQFYFDGSKKNICIVEEIVYNCDSCATFSFQKNINAKFPKWKPLENGIYKTKFPYQSVMEKVIQSDTAHILRFTFKGWKGGRYEHFLENFLANKKD